jgi:hypothetical protein
MLVTLGELGVGSLIVVFKVLQGGWKRPVDGVERVLVQGIRHTRRLTARRNDRERSEATIG